MAERRRDVLGKRKSLSKAREAFALRIVKGPDRQASDFIAEIDEWLLRSIGDSAEYAAMIRVALRPHARR